MFDPRQFQLNEAWIVFRLNEVPIVTEVDGDFNVLALMDAASGFMLGTEFIPASSMEPSQLESKRLLKNGQSHQHLLPKQLVLPTELVAEILSSEAERNGIVIVRLPEKQLRAVTSEAIEGFNRHIGGG